VDAVEKALGEPWLAQLEDDALKVRRNLLVASLISIGATVAGVGIAVDSPVFGFHLRHLTYDLLRLGMLLTICYLLLHFAWYAFDGLCGWRLRVTGTRQGFITAGTFGSDDLDYTGEFRNSTLYNWWKNKMGVLQHLGKFTAESDASFKELRAKIEGLMGPEGIVQNTSTVLNSLNAVEAKLTSLESALTRAQETDDSARIRASLKRFDNWFQLWLRSQNLRWLVIDVGAPLVLGVAALVLLIFHH